MSDSVYRDRDLRREILAMLLFDRQFLRRCGEDVKARDFEPSGCPASVLADMALGYWKRHGTPVAASIGAEIGRWDRGGNDGAAAVLKRLAASLKDAYQPDRSGAVQAEVAGYVSDVARRRAIRQLADLQSTGELTDGKWLEIMQSGLTSGNGHRTRDWLEGVEERIARRHSRRWLRCPQTLIEPLDGLVQSIARGHLGMWIAPYKRGKSLALIWLAAAYTFQQFNVLFLTLEDPIEDVEDRFDACIAEVRLSYLPHEGPVIEERIRRWGDMVRSRLRLCDGTEGGMTVAAIQSVWDRERASGFDADVVIIDYDDEIQPAVRNRDRRHEFAEIYRDLRQFAARQGVIVWTAAQATRAAENHEIVGGSDVAEDISKVRKATMAIGIGTCPEWNGEQGVSGNALTLNVAAHKFDKQGVSCRIWSDPARGAFFDREKTARWLAMESGGGLSEDMI